jgi:hypothetical protein
MMSGFTGMPDFGAPLEGGPTAIFAAYGDSSHALVLPDHLEVAVLPDGRPDFQLSLNRPPLATSAISPWGALRMRLAQYCPVDAALAAVRKQIPLATVSPALPAGGFARLLAAGSGAGLSADLSAPQPLNWANLSAVRFTLPRLDWNSAGLLKGALSDATLLIWACLEIEVPGVSPRLPLRVSFSPRALLGELLPSTRQIAWDDLVAGCARGPSALPLVIEGAGEGAPASADLHRLGEALADRIRAAFGRFVPSETGNRPTIEMNDVEALPDSVQWDLAQAVEARRPWALQLDPLAAPRALAAQGGLAGLVKEITQPVVDVGVREIAVSANLPVRRERVVAAGVSLRFPAHPPERLQEVVQSIDFHPPADEGVVHVRLSPKEPISYYYTSYLVVQTGDSIRRMDAIERENQGLLLELQPDDFPVNFVPVEVVPNLFKEARVSGRLSSTSPDGTAIDLPFTLSSDSPATTLPLPRDVAESALFITASPFDGSAPLTLGPLPTAPVLLGPWSFPQYGPQQVSISASFPNVGGLVAIDLLAEGVTETPQAVTTLHLTPEAPEREWTYFAASPFHAGYRYRNFVATGTPAPWSEIQPASRPLKLEADPPSDPAGSSSFDLKGVHLYVDKSSPAVLRYIPATPISARGPDGHPLMALFNLGTYSILQLSVRFDLEDSERDRLRLELSEQRFVLSAAAFQPAPMSVVQISVLLAPSEGTPPVVIATSSGSGAPPWDAIFSIKLTTEQAAVATRALSGQPGLLAVTVKANLTPETASTFPGNPSSIDRTADIASWTVYNPGPK